ncbi:UNVERIFIED_CONTAM: WD repeat-containing protein 87, partial [Siphonaria sp. JEL0065]
MDGIIKVWTQQFRVLFELRDEASGPITGLLIPNASEGGYPSPLLLSSSQDGVIRLWSLDSGTSIYAVETDSDCLGIKWMRRDTFLSHSQEGMSIWNLNRFFSTFTRTGSQITHLKRIEGSRTDAARILVATEDRSMRILSPVRGTTLFTAFPNMIEHQIKDIEHDIPSATMWMLSANGEVSVYTTETNPAKIVDIWEVEAGTERVNTMCALRKKNNSLLLTDRVYALLGGTVAGQIVIYPINVVNSKYQVIIQAHAAQVVALVCDTNMMIVISLGSDGLIKVWKMDIAAANEVSMDTKPVTVGAPSSAGMISLSLLYNITLPKALGHAIGFAFQAASKTLAVSSSHNIISMYTISHEHAEEKTRHPHDEDHMKSITCLVALENLNIFASSSSEGSVKIWDGYGNIMLKEVQFGCNVLSVCFCNIRGDLLVGTNDQVALIKMQDYLPPYILQELLFRSSIRVDDDLDEPPLVFDDTLDFWQLYRENLIKKGRDLSRWHLAETPPAQPPQQTELLDKLDDLEQKHAEAVKDQEEEQKAIIAKESWQSILRMKKKVERTLSANNLRTVSSQPVKTESFLQESSKPKRNKNTRGSSVITDDEKDIKPHGVNLDDDDDDDYNEEEDDVMTLDESVEFYKRRVSTFQHYRDKQQKQVEQELEEDNASVRRMSMRMSQENELTGHSRGLTMRLSRGERSITAHKRPSLLAGNVHYKKDDKHSKAEEVIPAEGMEESKSTQTGQTYPTVGKGKKKAVVLSKSKKGKTKGKSTQAEKETGATAAIVITEAIVEADEEAASLGTDSLASKNKAVNASSNTTATRNDNARLILEAPKRLKPTKDKARKYSLAGAAMPNSVAAASMQSSDKSKFQHRRESQVMDEETEMGFGPTGSSGASSLRPTKNFALPQHLRSRRKRESILPAHLQGVMGKSSENPELAEEPDESPDSSQSPEPILPIKSVISVAVIPQLPQQSVIKLDSVFAAEPQQPEPPTVREPTPPIESSPSPETSQESIPTIVVALDETETISLPKIMEPSRDPSLIAVDDREPSIFDKLLSKRQSFEATDMTDRLHVSKAPSKMPSLEFLPRVKSMHEIKYRKKGGKQQDGLERHPSEPTLLPPISLSSKSSMLDIDRPVNINLDAQKQLMAQKAWSLLEVATTTLEQEEDNLGARSYASLQSINLSKAELLDEVAAKDWFPGLNGKDANISNILDITMKVMKSGYWREKMEACKATLYLYHTFENDLPNAVHDIILPQLDFLNDDRWEVRAQFAMALGAYKVNNPEITLALISKLNDPSDAVKKAVKNSLATFGISSKEALRNMMGSLGLIPHITKKQKSNEDWLDILLERMRVQAE